MQHEAWQFAGLLLAISLLIGGHEFGHFLMARLLSVKVLRFAIGFGRPIWRKQAASGIEYVLGMIPLGGYVKLLDEREGPVAETELAKAFNRRSILQRCLIILAGPLANLILAFLLFWLIFCLGVGHLKPVIAEVLPNSLAAKADIPPKSMLTKVNGLALHSWSDFSMALLSQIGDKTPLELELMHKGHKIVRKLSLREWNIPAIKINILASIGIVAKVPTAQQLKLYRAHYISQQHYKPWQAAKASAQHTWRQLKFNFIMTYKLAAGIISLQNLTGPLTIFHGIQFALKQGLSSYLHMLAVLSIAIGFINLLPIPTLDGGHLLLLLIEAARGKPVSLAAQVLAYRLGFILLLLLMVKALTNDMLRLAS